MQLWFKIRRKLFTILQQLQLLKRTFKLIFNQYKSTRSKEDKVSVLQTHIMSTGCLHENALLNIAEQIGQSSIKSKELEKELKAEISSLKTESNTTQLDMQKQIQDLQETVKR